MKKFCLIGEHLSHSLSPQLHAYIFGMLGIEAEYTLLEVKKEELSEELSRLQNEGYCGANVTIPYKTEVMKYCSVLSDAALEIGAVNTLSFIDGKIIGDNTDVHGFSALLERNINPLDFNHEKVVVLGSGGGARAVCYALKLLGFKSISVASRTPKNEEFMQGVTYIAYDKISGGLLINTTPVGMYPNVDLSPVDEETVRCFRAVLDIIYNPIDTCLVKTARNNGLICDSGLYMLVDQAITSEEIWNGTVIDRSICDLLYNILSSELS